MCEAPQQTQHQLLSKHHNFHAKTAAIANLRLFETSGTVLVDNGQLAFLAEVSGDGLAYVYQRADNLQSRMGWVGSSGVQYGRDKRERERERVSQCRSISIAALSKALSLNQQPLCANGAAKLGELDPPVISPLP